MRPTRAALLPTPADPFLLTYWMHFFTDVWQEEVDKLYVCINSPIEKPVVDYMKDLLAKHHPKVFLLYYDVQKEHGYVLDRLLDLCVEDNVMLIEDDGFIFKKGVVDMYFKKLESGEYDVIGSPRGSSGMEIWNEAQKLWDLDYTHYGDNGPNFWPNFFFTRREILLKTDRNFGARNWVKGEKIEALNNYVVKEDNCPGDTFVNTSLQIRAMVPKSKILEIPQYHCSTDDQKDFESKTNLFDGSCPWLHVGSLSSGTHGALRDNQNRPLARREIDPPKARDPYCPNSEAEKLEWERRVSFWTIFYTYAFDNIRLIPSTIFNFMHAYQSAIERIIRDFGLSQSRIQKRVLIYRTLGL